MSDELTDVALAYHASFPPGKLGIKLTKRMDTQQDLALAYSPGVAAPVRAIASDPELVYKYTAKGNLVAVITDGSAVLGLGDLGPLASKPVMEGKAALFKRFANIDVFDIEIDAKNPQDFIDTVIRIAPTFGGINLEDIKGPQCFEIEQALIEKLDIPLFHDDQHGTAVIIAAGLLNALELQNKSLDSVKIVCVGAGAAGVAAAHLLLSLGVPRNNLHLVDRQGAIHSLRKDLNPYKAVFAIHTPHRSLADCCKGADVFIGVSGANVLTADMLASMAARPIVFALSNPDPEINPALAHQVRNDLILATGRSDYPNQLNNVLCFPYIFRGALDVRARKINRAMLLAVVYALKDLAKEPILDEVFQAYPGSEGLEFGPHYILPKPTDPRLIERLPQAVAKAAIGSGVAKISL